jgi:hypothetical protein
MWAAQVGGSGANSAVPVLYGLPIPGYMVNMVRMKTTVEISDALLDRAKRHAKRTGRPVRALIEEGLQAVLQEANTRSRYRLPDRSVGEPDAPNPLESLSWQDLRNEIYGER